VLQHKKATRLLFEDHSYEKREGGVLIAIVDVKEKEILVNTRQGKKTLAVK